MEESPNPSDDPFRPEDAEQAGKPGGCGRLAKLVLILGAITISIPIALMLLVMWDMGFLTPHPSDEALVDALRSQRQEFDQLLEMAREDSTMKVVHLRYRRPEVAITEARWNEYRQLLEHLETDADIRRLETGEVLFTMSTKGLAIGGSMKGLAYCPTPPALVFNSLDRTPAGLPPNQEGYRHIEGNWYVYFRFDP